MKTSTFIRKRLKFLEAMTLDYTVVPTFSLLMNIDFNITTAEVHVARNTTGMLVLTFTTSASAEAHDTKEMPSQNASMELSLTATAEANGAKDTPEDMVLADMTLGADAEAEKARIKETNIVGAAHFLNDVTPEKVNAVECVGISLADSITDIQAEGNAAIEAAVDATSTFTLSAEVHVEQLALREIDEATAEAEFEPTITAEANDTKQAEATSSMQATYAIKAYARPRKRVSGAVTSTFMGDIEAVVCRNVRAGDMHGVTIDTFFATGRTLERSLIVPV